MYVAAEKLRNINGPVYLTEESDHHNGEFIKAVDTDAKDLTGPVYMSKDSGKNVSVDIQTGSEGEGACWSRVHVRGCQPWLFRNTKASPETTYSGKIFKKSFDN